MILKNAQIYQNGVLKLGSLQIHDGKFQKIVFHEENEEPTFSNIEKNETVIECNNKILLPGIIDVHSHLRDLDQNEKETFITATQAAAASGITTVFDMPNTKPPAISSNSHSKVGVLSARIALSTGLDKYVLGIELCVIVTFCRRGVTSSSVVVK